MFFVFGHGNAQDGEAAGGTGDIRGQFHSWEDARDFAHSHMRTKLSDDVVEILNGETGQIFHYVCTNKSTNSFNWEEL